MKAVVTFPQGVRQPHIPLKVCNGAEGVQVQCQPPGNITVRVDGYKTDSSWLRFELLDVAGGGSVSSVQIRASRQVFLLPAFACLGCTRSREGFGPAPFPFQ